MKTEQRATGKTETTDDRKAATNEPMTIDGIVQGQINPLTATFLKLSVVKWPGRSGYISIDTRREE